MRCAGRRRQRLPGHWTQPLGGKRSGRPLELGASQSALHQGSILPEPCRTIRVYFIKPSRYDENGYVQFFRYGVQPNNTLTVLAALNDTFNKRYSAARNVYLQTVLWDEICDGAVSPETIVAIKEKAREDGVELLIGLPRCSATSTRAAATSDCSSSPGPAHDDGRLSRKRLSRVGQVPQQLRHHHDRGRGREPVGPDH